MFHRSNPARRPVRPSAPMLESLENRQLLSATVTLAGGVLTVTGTRAADTVTFERTGPANSLLRVRANGRSTLVKLASVNAIRVSTLAGNDRVDFDDDRGRIVKPTTLDGGDGNDRVDGSDGPDTILGGPGNDRIDGERGNDLLDGGAGNDALEGDGGNDTLLGAAGNDSLDGGDGTERLEGGDGADDLAGGDGLDTIFGNAGNDDFPDLGDDDILTEIKDRTAEDNGPNALGSGGGDDDDDDDDRSGSNSGRG